jgi:hypothetical protein
MKKIIGLIAICLATTFTALPALAQTTPQQPAKPTPQQPAATTTQNPQCTPETKLALYNEFRASFKTDTAKANELAKKWLACPEVAGEEQITPYLKNFVTLYEKASRKDEIHKLVYAKNDDPKAKTTEYAKALELAKQVLAEEPDNLKVLIDFAYAGYASKNPAYQADTLANAKKAIQLIESGKTLENWNPYVSKDEALGYLYNTIGSLNVQKNAAEGLPDLIKAAQFEGKLKKLPFTYGTIAEAYEAGPYAKQSEEYKAKFSGKDETPESKLALENINQIIDRMIDAYARAVALAGNDPQYAAPKKQWMDSLNTWYKFRNNQTDAGLTEMIAGILAKPLPPLPTPITTLPASTPGGTPASGTSNASGTNPSGSAASTTPAQPANTQPANPTTKPAATEPAKPATEPAKPATEPAKPGATPKPTPAPSKPRIKRNHRGR